MQRNHVDLLVFHVSAVETSLHSECCFSFLLEMEMQNKLMKSFPSAIFLSVSASDLSERARAHLSAD